MSEVANGDLMSVGQVAELVDIPAERVAQLAASGRFPLPFYRNGSLWSRAEIIGWINTGGLERANQAPTGEHRPDRVVYGRNEA